MQYILSEAEFQGLVSIERVDELKESLNKAKDMIARLSGQQCGVRYCDDCPIAKFNCDDKYLKCNKTHFLSK